MAAGGAGSAGPFVLTRSPGGKSGRPPIRATRSTVRPHSRSGATTIVFRLAKAAVVRFTVVRVSPTCERIGFFHVRGHAGVNRVKFRGRLNGRPLEAGTYRLLVRARGTGADAAALKLVVVRGKPLSVQELREARNANVCGLTTTVDGESVKTALGGSSAPGSDAGPASSDGGTGASGGGATGASRDGGAGASADPGGAAGPLASAGTIGGGSRALGARFTKAVDDASSIHPLVWGALALAILLLTIAAVPSGALVNVRAETIAYKRFEVALAGTAALAAAFFMYLVS